jgi:hypothetical protein
MLIFLEAKVFFRSVEEMWFKLKNVKYSRFLIMERNDIVLLPADYLRRIEKNDEPEVKKGSVIYLDV